MKERSNHSFLNLADALAEDILNASDEELLAEAAEDFGDPYALSAEFDRILASIPVLEQGAHSQSIDMREPIPTFGDLVAWLVEGKLKRRGSLTVTQLVREAILSPSHLAPGDLDAAGAEKALAIMMVDLRDYTRMAQGRLPYDVVYVLNEFFSAVGNAIITHGGTIDKFLGDGLLAFFGRENGVQAGCRDALCAARAIDLALDHVNAKLEAELGNPLRVAMGLHTGQCILGRIGFGPSCDVTVIGNAVNVASRFEALAKSHGFQIMASKEVIDNVAWTGSEAQTIEVEVRGVVSKMQVIGIARGRDLPISILTQSPEAYTDT